MASKQRKLKRFTGELLHAPVTRSAEKSGTPAAEKPSPKVFARTALAVAAITPSPGKIARIENSQSKTKIVRPASRARHVWSPPQLPAGHDIPSSYNKTCIRMIPRGPHHVFSFWDLGSDALEKVTRHCSDSSGEAAVQPVLRLYTMGPGKGNRPRRIGDIVLSAGADSHYVRVPESGRTYRLDLGAMTQSGRFVPVCRSNEAATPRARVGKAADSGPFRGDTRKLIEFSLLSGRMIPEADDDSGTLGTEDNRPIAMEPDDDAPGQRTNPGSWSGPQLTQDFSTP